MQLLKKKTSKPTRLIMVINLPDTEGSHFVLIEGKLWKCFPSFEKKKFFLFSQAICLAIKIPSASLLERLLPPCLPSQRGLLEPTSLPQLGPLKGRRRSQPFLWASRRSLLASPPFTVVIYFQAPH